MLTNPAFERETRRFAARSEHDARRFRPDTPPQETAFTRAQIFAALTRGSADPPGISFTDLARW